MVDSDLCCDRMCAYYDGARTRNYLWDCQMKKPVSASIKKTYTEICQLPGWMYLKNIDLAKKIGCHETKISKVLLLMNIDKKSLQTDKSLIKKPKKIVIKEKIQQKKEIKQTDIRVYSCEFCYKDSQCSECYKKECDQGRGYSDPY